MFGVIRLATRESSGENHAAAEPPRASRPLLTRGATKRTITFIDYTSSLTNPRQDGSSVDKRRKDVRIHAAMASAEKRKATIAKRDAYGWQRRRVVQLHHAQKFENLSLPAAASQIVGPETTAFNLLADLVTELNPDSTWFLGPIERTSLPSKAIRNTLWGAVTNHGTLFQAAVFVAGTHSNTCGLPPTAIHDLSTGMLLLRGASLAAIQAAVIASEVESLTPVAIAMLAGWERRFGDKTSYEVHMKAWRDLSIPAKALDDNNVSTLADLTLETFREGLDERAASAAIKLEMPDETQPLTCLPPGFRVFHTRHPETCSILAIISELVNMNGTSPDSIARLRRLGLENMAWNPCHSVSCHAIPAQEELWDQAELNALYHLRAGSISVGALLLLSCHHYHGVPWVWDMASALAVHTVSCQHLRTEELLGTKYEELAIWTRFVLCATSRDPDRDYLVKSYLTRLGLTTWNEMKRWLENFWWAETLIGEACRTFFDLLFHSDLGRV